MEYNRNNTLSDAKTIRDEAWRLLDSETQRTFDYPSYKMFLCYFLWLINSHSEIKSAEDLCNVYQTDNIFYNQMLFRDLYYVLEDDDIAWESIKKFALQYTETELAACVQKLIGELDDYKEEISQGIIELSLELLQIQDAESILHYNCGNADFVLEGAERYPESNFVGFSSICVELSQPQIKSDIMGYHNTYFTEDLEESPFYEKFDKFLVSTYVDPTITRYERIFWNDEIENLVGFPVGCSTQWDMCADALATSNGYKCGIALVNSGQLTGKQTINARKYLVDHGMIEGVIQLPDKVFLNTWVNPYIVVFGHDCKKIKFLDARDRYIADRVHGKRVNIISQNDIAAIIDEYRNSAKCISVNEVALRDYNLNPLRYLAPTNLGIETITLGSLVSEIRRGMTLSAAEADAQISEAPSDIKCIIPGSITNGIITPGLYYHGEKKKLERNTTNWNSLLVSKNGIPFRTAVSDGWYLAVGNIYICSIARDARVNAAYIKCFLSSARGQAEIGRLSSGTVAKMISVENLKKIQIPVYDERKQEALNQRAEEIIHELEDSYKRIRETEESIDVLFDQIIER